MIETGARSSTMKSEEIANIVIAAATSLSGKTTVLKEEKKSQTQNYINKLVQDYNKARQE